MTGTLDVRTAIPLAQYRELHVIAQQCNTTVGAVVAEIVNQRIGPTTATPAAPMQAADRKPRRNPTADDMNNLVRMWERGMIDAAIAHELGMSRTWVAQKRQNLGLKAHNPRTRKSA